MTPGEIETLTKEIVASLDSVGAMVGVIAPPLIPILALGMAIDKVVPGLAKTVASWIEGNPPTPEELADFQSKLAVLSDPSSP